MTGAVQRVAPRRRDRAHDRDRAAGPVDQVLADRAEQQTGEAAVPAAAHHDQLRVAGQIGEQLAGGAVPDLPLDGQVRCRSAIPASASASTRRCSSRLSQLS